MAIAGKYGARAQAGMTALQRFYDAPRARWTSGWWNSANALETTLDYMARTGDAAYAHVIDDSFTKNRGQRFLNDFYDDEGWWALAWLKAYGQTHDQRYLDAAKVIFDDMTRGWDDTCGGGIWWNKAHEKKNAIANELFLSIAARLHLATANGAATSAYLDWAQRTWSWFDRSGMINAQNLINDGLRPADCRNDGGLTWTYNQGVILGALVALREAAHDDALLERAKAIADAALRTLTDAGGILHEPTAGDLGDDGPQFKGIFMRNLCELYGATGQASYRDAILTNANAVWAQARDGANAFGAVWAGPFDRAGGARQSSAIDALNGAISFDAPGKAYQAEDAVLHGLTTEARFPGFHGSGYVAGWDRDGQAVEFRIEVPAGGAHDAVFRYAAIGDAVRSLRINGKVVNAQQAFAGTGTWETWRETPVYDVALAAGANVVSVAFDAANGSRGWLNLDELTVR